MNCITPIGSKMKRNRIFLLQSMTTMILRVTGNEEDSKKFFKMVADPVFGIGSFDVAKAIISLKNINSIYEDFFKMYNFPTCISSKATVRKFNGKDMLFFACFEGYESENLKNCKTRMLAGRRDLAILIGCYAKEFPNLEFFITTNNSGAIDPISNNSISISEIISETVYDGLISPERCRKEAQYYALYSPDKLKYKTWLAKVNPILIRENSGFIEGHVDLIDKRRCTFIM